MPTLKPWLLYSLLILVLLLLGIGVIVGVWIKNWPWLTLKSEVDVFSGLISLLSLLVTVAAAFWVTTILEKRSSDSRAEKDIIIRQTDQLYLIIEEIREKIRSGTIDYTLAASNFKRMNVNTAAIIVSMVAADIYCELQHEGLIRAEVAILKDLVTNTQPNDPDLTVANNMITLSSSRRILVDTQLDKIRNEVYKLQLAINRA